MKILAVVKFNDGFALVIDRQISYKYTRFGNTILGQDGIFFTSLGYAKEKGMQAFGGSKFTRTMEDGEVIECKGDWWDGMTKTTLDKVGSDIVRVVLEGIEALKHCYVFSSAYVSKAAYEKFLLTYTGKKYGYWEYEAKIKGLKKPWRFDPCETRKRKNHRRFKKVVWI